MSIHKAAMTPLVLDAGASVLWVITTAYNVFIFPEKVSTDVASWVTVTVRGVGGKDGKQTFVYLEIAFSAWCLWWP